MKLDGVVTTGLSRKGELVGTWEAKVHLLWLFCGFLTNVAMQHSVILFKKSLYKPDILFPEVED